MDITNQNNIGGSLHISGDVIAKIALLAAKEVDGVFDVAADTAGVKGLINKISPARPIVVEMNNDVAEISVSIVVKWGYRIPEISEKVQESVKTSVQNMTQISVSKVDVLVTGIRPEAADDELQ